MTREDTTSAQAAAHAAAWIEEGWNALEGGDIERAETACSHAEAATPDLPDCLHLRGAIAEARGEADLALDLYQRAASADPEFPSPRLGAAGLLLDRGEVGAARELAEAAVASAEDEERVEALLICAEIAATAGDGRATRKHLSDAAAAARDPAQILAAAQALLDAGDPKGARSAYERARERGAAEADVHYGLGRIAEEQDDRDAMITHFLEVARLDRESPPDYRLTEEEFEKAAEEAMSELPDQVVELLENVPVLLDDAPSEDLIREGIEPRLLGLFTGVPLPEKSHVGGGETPHIDAVHLFRQNLERAYTDRDELVEQIRITVLHETAHFFGLEDDDLHRMGLG